MCPVLCRNWRHQEKDGRSVSEEDENPWHKSKSWKSESSESESAEKCPQWGQWQQSQCLWPTMNYSSIPETCTTKRTDKSVSPILQDFKTAKAKEIYDTIGVMFANRGASKMCGYCSRKIRCRIRQQLNEDRECDFKEMKVVDEDCEDKDACVLSTVMGGCPAPVPHFGTKKPRNKNRNFGFRQDGPFHYYAHHWTRFGGDGSSWRGRGPRAAEVGFRSFAFNQTAQYPSSQNITTQTSVPLFINPSNEIKAKINYTSKSSEENGRTTDFPLWHCVKTKDDNKCLCCCGNYFPDLTSGVCKLVKNGAKISTPDRWNLISGGLPQN